MAGFYVPDKKMECSPSIRLSDKLIISDYQDRESDDGDKVLDVGTGTGRLEKAITEYNRPNLIIGIDTSHKMLRHARKRIFDFDEWPNYIPLRLSVVNMDFPSETFDYVFSSFALHHIKEFNRAIKKISNCLKPGKVFSYSDVIDHKSIKKKPKIRRTSNSPHDKNIKEYIRKRDYILRVCEDNSLNLEKEVQISPTQIYLKFRKEKDPEFPSEWVQA